ncbi:early endosome antigen 1-like isoform X2 [Dysidea avara]|uniref:early endosome antigen 1-like isoform X2 n=1 Tax=Dysidea avara TaxID=196820 RepID=UPI003316D3D2
MSETDDITAIKDSFILDGVSWEIDANMKLRHLWKKLQRTEDALKSSHSENTTLKKEKKEEMDAIQKYLENIRNLSSQKEQLVKELEDENRLLKSNATHVDQIQVENEALLAQIHAITELTSNEELQQQFTGKTVVEQVQVLLEDRSSASAENKALQSELQTARNSQSSLQQQLRKALDNLEKEKESHQVIMNSRKDQEDNTKLVETLKKAHEKEKSELLQKYFKINTQMAESKQKIARLQDEIKQTKTLSSEQHQKELLKAKSSAEAVTTKLKQVHEAELKRIRKDSEVALAKLKAELSSVAGERDTFKRKLSDSTEHLRDIQEQMKMLQHDQTTKTESQMVTAQAELSRMEHTNSTLASKMEALKAELKDAQTRENQLKDSLLEVDQEVDSYKQQLHHANNEISELTNQLQETIASRDSETRQLKTALANTESAMQTLQQELHTSTAQMAAQVSRLERELANSTDKVSHLQSELQSHQDRKLETEQELKAELDSIREEVDSERQRHKEASEMNVLLTAQLEQKQKELQATVDSLTSREEASQQQKLLLSGEKQKMISELQISTCQLTQKQESINLMEVELNKMREQNSLLVSETNQHRDSMASLRDQLASTEQEREQLKHETEQLQEDNRQKTSNCSKLHSLQVQHEATISHLHTQIKELKTTCSQAKQESSAIKAKQHVDVEKLKEENRALMEERDALSTRLQSATDTYKSEKVRRQEEITHLQKMLQEAQVHSQQQAKELQESSLKVSQSQADSTKELQVELQQCKEKVTSLEEENHKLDLQGNKLQAQLMELEEKAAVAGASQLTAEQELSKQVKLCRRADSKLAKALNEKTAIQKELQQSMETIEKCKQKIEDMSEKMFTESQQRDWVTKEKDNIEEQQQQKALLQSQLEETKELLQKERLSVALLKQSQEAFTEQMTNQKQIVAQLETSLAGKMEENLELKSSAKIQKQRAKKLQEQIKQLETDNQLERENVSSLQQEVNILQLEILSMEGRLEGEHQRMNKKSRRSLDKLHSSKEKHTKERLSLESSISQLQENLCSAKLRLDKETQWRVNNEAMQRKLLEEKSLLLTKLAAAENENQQKQRQLVDAETHISQLQHENELMQVKANFHSSNSKTLESSVNLLGSYSSSLHALPTRSEPQTPT